MLCLRKCCLAQLPRAPSPRTRDHLTRVSSGSIRAGDALVALDREGHKTEEGKVTRLFARRGMAAVPLDVATAGDIVQVRSVTLRDRTASSPITGTTGRVR